MRYVEVCWIVFFYIDFAGHQGIFFQRRNNAFRELFNGTVFLPGVAEEAQKMEFPVKISFVPNRR